MEIFILEAGTSTVSCFAVFALRILVSISAIGSFIVMVSVIFVTTAKTDEEARELLTLFGMPFSK
mgnify:CR=1 FL=1